MYTSVHAYMLAHTHAWTCTHAPVCTHYTHVRCPICYIITTSYTFIQAAYAGMHAIFVPPSVMFTQPTAWLHTLSKQKGNHTRTLDLLPAITYVSSPSTASCIVSSSKAISSCISLVGNKDMRDVTLDSVRFFLLGDGANPCKMCC